MSELKKYKTIFDMIEDHNKDNIAITYDEEHTKTSIYYGDLEERILFYPIDKTKNMIGIICDNSIDNILCILAYLYHKKTIVLLSSKEKIETLQQQIDTVGIDYIEGPDSIVDNLSPAKESFGILDNKILFFTSTKAVILTEEKLCLSAYNGSLCLPLRENDELLCLLPINHVFGFVCSWLWAWQSGASVILARGGKHLFENFEYFKPTVVSLVPQLAGAFLLRNSFNKELRLILVGGGDCPESILIGLYNKGIHFSYGYGLTETSSGVALSLGKNPRAFSVCPMDDIILDDDDEILIKCDDLMFEAYYPNNFSYLDSFTEDGYFRTGDLGYFDDDHLLHLKGRKKDLLVLTDGSKILLNIEEEKLKELLHLKDLALGLNQDGEVTLVIGNSNKEILPLIREDITKYNEELPRLKKISKIIVLTNPLPKDIQGKIKRFEIDYDEK